MSTGIIEKVADLVEVGDVIRSPHTPSYLGEVVKIDKTEKKLTLHILFVAGEMKGRHWDYSFFKTTKVKVVNQQQNQ